MTIATGQLALHYQPQLDLRTGEALAVEALLRWAHPRLGLLPPMKFLPLAEEAGLMPATTSWVVEEAAGQCAAWREAGRLLSVAVNVSPSCLLEGRFVALIRQVMVKHQLPAGSLVVEITEQSVISDLTAARGAIARLAELGVTVSVDDFGAGATSLAYLGNLAVGELKLDLAFVAGLQSAQANHIDLIRSTIELGHAIGLRIVAEGIEDAETLSMLAGLGCDLGQGYGIGMPKPAGELAFRFDHAESRSNLRALPEDLPASA